MWEKKQLDISVYFTEPTALWVGMASLLSITVASMTMQDWTLLGVTKICLPFWCSPTTFALIITLLVKKKLFWVFYPSYYIIGLLLRLIPFKTGQNSYIIGHPVIGPFTPAYMRPEYWAEAWAEVGAWGYMCRGRLMRLEWRRWRTHDTCQCSHSDTHTHTRELSRSHEELREGAHAVYRENFTLTPFGHWLL